ncbi:MAG: TonB-dependent receptor [Caulobacter sp.]|nr:TonB-dependent receptor [Caulobacter sp.]
MFASAACIASALTVTAAAAAPAVVVFDIPAGDLGVALERYATQSRQQLLYSPSLVAGRRSPTVRGAMTVDQALAQLLAGSGITVQRPRAGVVVLHGPQTGTTTTETADDVLGPQENTLVDEIVVTGTLIRGSAAPAAPVVVLKRDDIDRTGAGTLAEALNALPQAFGGSATPDTFMTGGDNNNSTAATGINLRGLGADATLVLVNGRRLAGSGAKGDFADVSSIPLAAVDRVDVLLDGASALYGSDAVGGVVNIILKTDFEGAETRVRGGFAEGGAAEEFSLGQTFGFQWDGGGLLLSGEYYRRDALRRADRDYAASADLTRFGGTDHRNFLSSPGNILVFDPATFSFVVGWAIPDGQDGTALAPSDFLAGQINKGDLQEGMDLLPRQSRASLYGHLNHALTDTITLRAEARYSDRRFEYRSTSPVTAAFVTSANPFFVSPDGSSSHLLVYSFLKEAGPARASGGSESVALSLGVDIDLPRGWRAEAYAAYGRDLGSTRTENLIQNAFMAEALGSAPDQPTTAYNAATDGYLNLFGDGRPGANTQAVLDFVTSGWAERNTESAVGSVNVLADGDLWTLPGGTVKLAVGGQLRRETFDQFGVGFASTPLPNPYSEPTYQRDVWAVFGEARIPLIGEGNARPGIRRLELSVAGRIEGYDDVGQTADPKLGVVWEPTASLTLRGTLGTSFRAPTLKEVYEVGEIGPATLPRGNLDVLSVVLYGGNPDLEPETATSWTLGGDWRPTPLPDLQLTATWFDIDFEGRIGTPALENVDAALNDPALAPFVTLVDPSNPADLAKVEALISDPTFFAPGAYPANAYGAIVDARYVNTGRVRVRGLDLGARYRLDLGADTIDLVASATYLANFQRAVTPTAPMIELVDRAGQPVDWRARLAATWTHGPHQTTFAINYVDNYGAENGETVDAWTTLDFSWRWDLSGTFDWASGLQGILSVQNVFDADPPFYDNVRGYGYDPANADPLGRVLSLQLSRRW